MSALDRLIFNVKAMDTWNFIATFGDEWPSIIIHSEAELAALRQRERRLTELLRQTETLDYSDGWTCWKCHRNLVSGHAPDCELAALLHTTSDDAKRDDEAAAEKPNLREVLEAAKQWIGHRGHSATCSFPPGCSCGYSKLMQGLDAALKEDE